MGERITSLRRRLREFRRGEQKYSFHIMVANIFLAIVVVVLYTLGEFKLCVMLTVVMLVLLVVQGFLVWWRIHKQDREVEAWLMQAMEDDADA